MSQSKTNPLLAILRERGFTKVEIDYDGYGDSGDITAWRAWRQDEMVSREDEEVTKAIDEYGYDIIPFDWMNNDGAFGTITIDVATGKAGIENTQRYTDYDESSHEVQL